MGHMTPDEVVWRARGGATEAAKDREMLWWIGRFRYTSVELLAMRFEVAPQNVRVRLKRLAAEKLVRLERRSVNDAWLISLTGAGARVIGQPRRKPPRAELHQAHELAIGWLCARLELRNDPEVQVLTEREMRQRDGLARGAGEPRRYAVDVDGAADGQRTRWPDLVLVRDGRPIRAVEIEFAQKTDARLQRIVDAYLYGSIPEVVFLTANPHLAEKITRMATADPSSSLGPVRWAASVTVAPWPAADDATKARVRASIDAASLAN